MIDVKQQYRKTKKIGESKVSKNNKTETDKNLQNISKEITKKEINKF